MFFRKASSMFLVLILILSVLAVAMPGAAAPQRGNATTVYSSYSQTTSTTYTKVVQDGVVLKDEKKTETKIKQAGTVVPRPLFPGAKIGNAYMYASNGRPYLAFISASDDGTKVSGRIAVAGNELDWAGDIMTYGHSVRVELIDNGTFVAKWEDSDPGVSNGDRCIDYLVPYSGTLGPQAYLRLYVDDKQEFETPISENQELSANIGVKYNANPATEVSKVTLQLGKSFSGYVGVYAISFMSNGDYVSDPNIRMIGYFSGKTAVYKKAIPLTGSVNPSSISVSCATVG